MSVESRPDERSDAPRSRAKRRAKPARKHTIGRVILVATVVLALATSLSVIYFVRHLDGNLNVKDLGTALGDDRPEEVYKGNGKPLDILVIGSDTRDGEGNAIDSEKGGGLSDTTILVHLSADRSRAYAVSIPRDSIVDRPDCGVDDEVPGGTDKWNVAYAVGERADPAAGGAACVIRQVEATTGIRVEHFIEVDFNGFRGMVDAVGGVPVCIPEDIKDPKHGIFIEAGDPNLLEGAEALDYVRVRYVGPITSQNDLSRIKRQQNFIAALVNKVTSAGTLTRVDKVTKFLDAATQSLTLDEGIGSITRLARIGMQLQNIGLDKVQFVTVPNAYFTRDSDWFGSVYWTEEADGLWAALREDRPLPASLTKGAITAAKPPGSSASPEPGEASSSPSAPTTEQPTPDEEEAAQEARDMGLCS
ncbi:MAG: LCP family protein [Nocardioides sp.]|nr:LCP family protein [Nocardioides sp.]